MIDQTVKMIATVVDFTAKAYKIAGRTTMITGICTTPSAIARSDSYPGAWHPDGEEADPDQQGLNEGDPDDAIRDRFHRGRDDVHVMLAALPVAGDPREDPGDVRAQRHRISQADRRKDNRENERQYGHEQSGGDAEQRLREGRYLGFVRLGECGHVG